MLGHGITFNLKSKEELEVAYGIWDGILVDNEDGRFMWCGQYFKDGQLEVAELDNALEFEPSYKLTIRCTKED